MEAGVEAGRGVHYEDEVGREVADHVAHKDGPDRDGEVDLLVPHPPVPLPRLMSHHRAVDVADNVDDLQVAEDDDAVGEGWYKYSVEIGKAVAARPSEDGAGTFSVQLSVSSL